MAKRSSAEYIYHFNAVRMRLVGTGNLKMEFKSFDDVNEQVLVPFPMVLATNIQPTRLANFKDQRARLEFKTTEIDEKFKINKILIFSKPMFTGYPG